MDFDLFVYSTIGRRHELEQGMAGHRNDLYQRMLLELAEYVRLADDAGYAGFGHPEHHLQIEGFEISNDPRLMSMFLGQHRERLRIITCGFVSTTHNPLRVAEDIATLDHMHQGKFGVGLVRGYQARWVENLKVRNELNAVGPWNKNGPADEMNRRYFEEFVDVVAKALTTPTFSHDGEFWRFPNLEVNPHDHPVYREYGEGVDDDMTIREIGIAPRPYQDPHPQFYGGFTGSMSTAQFWAKYGGKVIALSSNLEFCQALWSAYDESAADYGRAVAPGDQACWGGVMICAETDEQAWEQFKDWEWFWNQWAVSFGQPMPMTLVGSPDTITRHIEAAADAVPLNECMLLFPQGLHTRDQVLSSLDLFASQVMPRFQ